MSLHLQKEEAKFALIAAMLRMLIVMRLEHGEHVDGIASDFSMSGQGDFSGSLASLVGNIEAHGESL